MNTIDKEIMMCKVKIGGLKIKLQRLDDDEESIKKVEKKIAAQVSKLEKFKIAKQKALMPIKVKQSEAQLKLRRAEKIECSCGSSVRRSDYAKHCRTQIHIRNVK